MSPLPPAHGERRGFLKQVYRVLATEFSTGWRVEEPGGKYTSQWGSRLGPNHPRPELKQGITTTYTWKARAYRVDTPVDLSQQTPDSEGL